MITIEQLTFHYPETAQPTLHNLTLHIAAGSLTLIMGRSGEGKSTLARCIGGLVPHFSGGSISGHIRVAERDPIALGPGGMSRIVGYVFQEPEAQAVMDRVEDEIAFALEYTGLSRTEMRLRIEEVLDLLDLAALRNRPLDQLSGGERQRVAIASALALRPHILVLDEPTSQLDPQSAEDVLQALIRLNNDLGLTIILVEHRIERVLPFVDHIIYLDGDNTLSGPPAQVLPHLPHVPPLIAVARTLGWSPLPVTIKQALPFARATNVQRNHSTPPLITSPTILELHHVHAAYLKQAVLEDINLTIRAGEFVALLGRNGAGKSSLLKLFTGLLRPVQGRVLIDGRDIASRDTAALCRDIGYLPQDPNALLFAESVMGELDQSLRNQQLTDRSYIPQLLMELGLSQYAQTYPRDLSVGERQRVALAAVLVSQPRVILLDEPTRGLDYGAKQRLAELLRTWHRRGMTVLLVTHDVEFVAGLVDRVILLGHGAIVADGPTATVLGTSPLFAPQIARLFPTSGWLTAEQALQHIAP